MSTLVTSLKDAGQDFEFYPTTRRMVDAVIRSLGTEDRVESILDVGAGDGRVLMQLAKIYTSAKLYAIEKSPLLLQAQPDAIVPVGTEFFEQNLMTLPVDVLFSNPPYSIFEEWVERLISSAHARTLFLVIPQRWKQSAGIQAAIKAREARTQVIHTDDFFDAERASRAVVHVVRVSLGSRGERWGSRDKAPDPFDVWFDQNIDTFDRERTPLDPEQSKDLARIRALESIPELVAAYDEDYARLEANYKAIFALDAAILKEVGVNKESVREGLKAKISGLKRQYWSVLFDKLDVITSRLTTRTKKGFLDRLNGTNAVGFTAANAYAVVLWSIKAANGYFDTQLVELFRELATKEGVLNYTSNQRTWEKQYWRYNAETDGFTHFALDYRIVLPRPLGIFASEWGRYDYPGNLHTSAHEQIADVVAVMSNLGFPMVSPSSLSREWVGGKWQDWVDADGAIVFQVKAYQNGNLHFRFRPAAIKALNVEAGRLLGWLKSPADAVSELGYKPEEVTQFFGANKRLGAAAVKLLPAAQEG